MGLLTTHIIIKWSNKTKNYYIKKGYIFTKLGDEFIIDIKDLSNGSGRKVQVECDCKYCEKKILTIAFANYNKFVKEDGKYYCNKCSINLFARTKMYEKKLSIKLKVTKSKLQ